MQEEAIVYCAGLPLLDPACSGSCVTRYTAGVDGALTIQLNVEDTALEETIRSMICLYKCFGACQYKFSSNAAGGLVSRRIEAIICSRFYGTLELACFCVTRLTALFSKKAI